MYNFELCFCDQVLQQSSESELIGQVKHKVQCIWGETESIKLTNHINSDKLKSTQLEHDLLVVRCSCNETSCRLYWIALHWLTADDLFPILMDRCSLTNKTYLKVLGIWFYYHTVFSYQLRQRHHRSSRPDEKHWGLWIHWASYATFDLSMLAVDQCWLLIRSGYEVQIIKSFCALFHHS